MEERVAQKYGGCESPLTFAEGLAANGDTHFALAVSSRLVRCHTSPEELANMTSENGR